MHVNFKNSSLLILAITAVVCSRIMFAFFHDPEGPNLLSQTSTRRLQGSKEVWRRFSSRYSSQRAFTWDCAEIDLEPRDMRNLMKAIGPFRTDAMSDLSRLRA